MGRKIHERNKRYGWLLLLAALNWIAIGLTVWKVDPETIRDFLIPGSYLPMMILLTGGVFWLLSILFLSAIRAARWTGGIVVFVYLRILGLGNLLNAALIFGLLLSVEFYYLKEKKEKVKESGITLNK